MKEAGEKEEVEEEEDEEEDEDEVEDAEESTKTGAYQRTWSWVPRGESIEELWCIRVSNTEKNYQFPAPLPPPLQKQKTMQKQSR